MKCNENWTLEREAELEGGLKKIKNSSSNTIPNS